MECWKKKTFQTESRNMYQVNDENVVESIRSKLTEKIQDALRMQGMNEIIVQTVKEKGLQEEHTRKRGAPFSAEKERMSKQQKSAHD